MSKAAALQKRKEQMKDVFDDEDDDSSGSSSGGSDSENSSSEEEELETKTSTGKGAPKSKQEPSTKDDKNEEKEEDDEEEEEETELMREQRMYELDEARRKEAELKTLKEQKTSESKKKKTAPKKRRAIASSSEEEDEDEEEGESSSSEEEESSSEDEKKKGKVTKKQPLRKNKASKPARKRVKRGSDSEISESEDEMEERVKGKKRREVFDDDVEESQSEASGGESEEEGRSRGKPGEKVDEKKREIDRMEVDLMDVIAMQLTRDILVQWADEKYFDTCIGGYVRLAVGSATGNPDQTVYRVCEIVGLRTVEPYKVDNEMVEYQLELQHGKFKKVWPLTSISNQTFSQDEFDLWVVNMKKAKKKVPNKGAVSKFERKVTKNVKEYQPTEADIREKIERKKRRRKTAANLTTERTELERLLAVAKENNAPADEVSDLEAKIEEIRVEQERRLKRIYESNAKSATVNQRNAKLNLLAKGNTMGTDRINARGEKVWNPFARMPTRPTNLWSTLTPGEAAAAGGEGEANGSGKDKADGEQKQGGASNGENAAGSAKDALGLSPFKKSSGPRVREVKTIHGHINIELDELEQESGLENKQKKKTKLFGSATKKSAVGSKKKKKSMSLEEYVRRMSSAE